MKERATFPSYILNSHPKSEEIKLSDAQVLLQLYLSLRAGKQ